MTYFKKQCSTKLKNLKEKKEKEKSKKRIIFSIHTNQLPKLQQDHISYLNRLITPSEIETAIKNLLTKKAEGQVVLL